MTPTTPALKEWAVAVNALGTGAQTLLLRKGGIDEKQFHVPAQRFLLFPTYIHQQQDLLKPAWHADYRATLAHFDRDQTQVTVRYFATLANVWTTWDDTALEAVSDFHIWHPQVARTRLHWRPKHPLYLLNLRVLALPQPITLPMQPEYGGCKSWLDLPLTIDESILCPVVDDPTFAARQQAIATALSPYLQQTTIQMT
jgi:hypothetical protein